MIFFLGNLTSVLARANLSWPMGFGTIIIQTLFALFCYKPSTLNKLIRVLTSFDSQHGIKKPHRKPVLPELSMASTCDVEFWVNLWLLSPSLSPQTSSSVSQTFPDKASKPRVSPALRMRRNARSVRLWLRASSGGCGTSRHEASIWSSFPFGLLKDSLLTLSTLLSSYKAMACCYSDFHRVTVSEHQTWLRCERFKSRCSSRMSLSDAFFLRVSSTEPGSRLQIIKSASKTKFRVHISPEQIRLGWKVKLFPEDQLNPDRFGSVLIFFFCNVNNNR